MTKKRLFKNEWYPILLITSLCIVLATQFLNLLGGKLIFPLVHIIISLYVLVALIRQELNYRKVMIKIWSIIAIIGGALGLLSTGVFVLIGRVEGNIEMSKVLVHLAHLVVGAMIFHYYDKSIADQDA